MSEFSAVLTPEDIFEFAPWLSDVYGSSFVVDDDRPAVTEASDIEAIRPGLLQDLLLSDRWSSRPLYKRKATNRFKGDIHCVMPRCGGPAFIWMPGNRLRGSEVPALPAGLFMDYPNYYLMPDFSAPIDRPPAVAAAFRASRKLLRKMCEGQ